MECTHRRQHMVGPGYSECLICGEYLGDTMREGEEEREPIVITNEHYYATKALEYLMRRNKNMSKEQVVSIFEKTEEYCDGEIEYVDLVDHIIYLEGMARVDAEEVADLFIRIENEVREED